MDLDTIKTAVDIGLGAVALVYAHRVSRVLDKHETRIHNLEEPPKPRPRSKGVRRR